MFTKTRSRFIPLLGLLVVLALAFVLNRWLYIQGHSGFPFFYLRMIYIWNLVGGLFLITVWLALAWITLILSRRSNLVSIIFLAVGLLVYSYPGLNLWFSWLPVLVTLYSTSTPFSYTGIFIVVLGVLHLLLPINSSAKG